MHDHRAERGRADDVLQWFPLDALRNERTVSLEEVGPRFDEGQLPAVDTRGMGCEEFGIGAR